MLGLSYATLVIEFELSLILILILALSYFDFWTRLGFVGWLRLPNKTYINKPYGENVTSRKHAASMQ